MSDPGDSSRGPVETPHVDHGEENSNTAVKRRMNKNVAAESVPMDKSRGVLCEVCPERAFKSCVTCMASFCKEHVKMHHISPALQKHELVEATENLKQMVCQQHYRPFELFCKTDQIQVCSICVLKHDGHEITDLNMAKKEYGSSTMTGEDKLAPHHQKFPFLKDPFPKETLAVEEHLIKRGSLNCYELPTKKSNISKDGIIRRWTFGAKDSKIIIKTILLVGETGAGKTTLLNTMVNYMLGVEPKDRVWFEITEDNKKKSQTESQTAVVTVYEVFVKTSSLLLRIIDTPGYGSTGGIEFDLEVAESMLCLFRSEDGVHEITVVGLVVKAGQNRLTDHQTYVLSAIMSLFGQDIGKSIVPLITHSDGMSVDNVITSLNEAAVPYAKDKRGKPVYFMFNNRQSEAYETGCEDLHWSAWDLGYRNMELFLRFLHDSDETQVRMTEDVLRERKGLEALVSKLQDDIEIEEGKQKELKQIQKALAKLENNENLSIQVEETFMDKAPINLPWYEFTRKAMCCTVCKQNCHYPGCWWVEDLSWCSVMKDGKCTMCRGKCPVSNHVKEKWHYKPKKRLVRKNSVDLRKKYGKQNIAKNLEKEINESKVQMKDLLEEAYDCILKLEDIALKKDSMCLLIHLDLLIKKVKEMGDEEKVKKLEEIQKRNSDAQPLRQVRMLSHKTFKK